MEDPLPALPTPGNMIYASSLAYPMCPHAEYRVIADTHSAKIGNIGLDMTKVEAIWSAKPS